jgi:hypothetical protein
MNDRPVPVGRFVFDVAEGSVVWSESLFEMHGFAPGEVVPTLELMAAHRHPDDRDRVAAAISAAIADGEPFSVRHRLHTAAAELRSAVTVGATEVRNGVQVMAGYVLDVTDVIAGEVSALTDQTVDAALKHRGTIEQAKGALMMAYSLDEDEAFALLRWHSQHGNVKLREVSEAVVEGISDPALAAMQPRRKIHHVLVELVGPVDVIPPDLASPLTAMLREGRAAPVRQPTERSGEPA